MSVLTETLFRIIATLHNFTYSNLWDNILYAKYACKSVNTYPLSACTPCVEFEKRQPGFVRTLNFLESTLWRNQKKYWKSLNLSLMPTKLFVIANSIKWLVSFSIFHNLDTAFQSLFFQPFGPWKVLEFYSPWTLRTLVSSWRTLPIKETCSNSNWNSFFFLI